LIIKVKIVLNTWKNRGYSNTHDIYTLLSGGTLKNQEYSKTIERIAIQRVTRQGRENTRDLVIKERSLSIILNNQELITLLCSPLEFDCLAIGFLASEGVIRDRDGIKKLTVDEEKGIARVETSDMDCTGELLLKKKLISGCSGASYYHFRSHREKQERIPFTFRISESGIFALVTKFEDSSGLFPVTGGVHSAALCDPCDILVFSEDIGRHNAIDKVFGRCILEGIPTEERILITSGRVSSEIMIKAARRKIPVFISRSAPTDMGIRLARDSGITLIGFVRDERMNIYTHDKRIDIKKNRQ
jgi:FdhD protein